MQFHGRGEVAPGRLPDPTGQSRNMHRRIIVLGIASVVLSGVVTLCFMPLSGPLPVGNFPPSFSAAERQEIVSAAQRDATRQTLAAIKRIEFRLAWRWTVNARRQTVRGVGQQQGGQIWVHFGIDDPKAPDGYSIWARYFMIKTNGHWEVLQLF